MCKRRNTVNEGEYNESVICRIIDGANSSNNALPPVRTSIVPQQFDNFVVIEPLPADDDDNLRRIAVECVDNGTGVQQSIFEWKYNFVVIHGIFITVISYLDVNHLDPFFKYPSASY